MKMPGFFISREAGISDSLSRVSIFAGSNIYRLRRPKGLGERKAQKSPISTIFKKVTPSLK